MSRPLTSSHGVAAGSSSHLLPTWLQTVSMWKDTAWWDWQDHMVCKNNDAVSRSLIWVHSSTFFMRTKNRTGDKAQLWHTPHITISHTVLSIVLFCKTYVDWVNGCSLSLNSHHSLSLGTSLKGVITVCWLLVAKLWKYIKMKLHTQWAL